MAKEKVNIIDLKELNAAKAQGFKGGINNAAYTGQQKEFSLKKYQQMTGNTHFPTMNHDEVITTEQIEYIIGERNKADNLLQNHIASAMRNKSRVKGNKVLFKGKRMKEVQALEEKVNEADYWIEKYINQVE